MSWRRVITRRNKEDNLTGSKRFDFSCRCSGDCPWCRENRLHSTQQRIEKMQENLEDYIIQPEENESDLFGEDQGFLSD